MRGILPGDVAELCFLNLFINSKTAIGAATWTVRVFVNVAAEAGGDGKEKW